MYIKAKQLGGNLFQQVGVEPVRPQGRLGKLAVFAGPIDAACAPTEPALGTVVEYLLAAQEPLLALVAADQLIELGKLVCGKGKLGHGQPVRFAEGLGYRLAHFCTGGLRSEINEVGHAGLHGFHALGLELQRVDVKVLAQGRPVHVDHDGAVVVAALDAAGLVGFARMVISVAAELAPFDGQVVAAAHLGVKPQLSHGKAQDFGLLGLIEIGAGQKEGEVLVAQVVVHRASTRKTAGKMPTVLIERLKLAFLKRALVSSDDHRSFVLPQIKYADPGGNLAQKEFLKGKVAIRVETIRANEEQGVDHAYSPSKL